MSSCNNVICLSLLIGSYFFIKNENVKASSSGSIDLFSFFSVYLIYFWQSCVTLGEGITFCFFKCFHFTEI